MNEIRTKHVRRLHSPMSGSIIDVTHTYRDQPATLETWIDNTTKLSVELGHPVTEIHNMLFKVFPEIFGR